MPTMTLFEVTASDADDIYSAFHRPDGIYYLAGEDQTGHYYQFEDDPVGPFDTAALARAAARDY